MIFDLLIAARHALNETRTHCRASIVVPLIAERTLKKSQLPIVQFDAREFFKFGDALFQIASEKELEADFRIIR